MVEMADLLSELPLAQDADDRTVAYEKEGPSMKLNKDLRQSLPAKVTAVVLLFVFTASAVLLTAALTLLSCGVGTSETFQDDMLCETGMTNAMDSAMRYVLEGESAGYQGYLYRTYMERAGGFSAQVYEGDSAQGELIGTWGDVPSDPLAVRTETFGAYSEDGKEQLYTVVGYLSRHLPSGSNFNLRFNLYNTLHSLHFGLAGLLAVVLYVCALVLLVFLFCAAGHKAGHDGICLNWQDRVPLDLYLGLMVGLVCLAAIPALAAESSWNLPVVMVAAGWCVSVIAWGFLALAAMLSLAARFKKGKWWRNTVCWRLVRWCKKLWKRFWNALMELVRILPMTWRTILAALGVLLVQSVLTLCIFSFYDGFFFLLAVAAMDIALLAGVAWMTRQLQKVRDMGSALAAGDLEAHLDTEKMYFDVKRHAEDLNAIGVGMNKAVEQRLKSERLKTELITNVSHDIKTPLTSIVNYVDLLKKEELPPAAQEYLMVLDRQSHRLKKLTEDLVEASKASTGNVAVNLEPIVVNEIIHQAIGDYDEKLAAGKLEVIVNTYEGNLMALADGRLLWRVLDNLLSNVCKYAMAGTRVYVDLAARDGKVVLSMKNISRDPLNVSAEELMERFVRGDASRHTEGSGLGLNIARSLMDLMGGNFNLFVDGDLFKAELTLRA